MVSAKLYVEGGGDSKSLHGECREGFARFLERAGLKGKLPRIVACGSRQKAFDQFKTAAQQGESAFLLLDSENLVAAGSSPWAHLKGRPGDGFVKPEGVTDVQCHFMVVCMESWFLADRDALSTFFGQGFHLKSLPQGTEIEAILKADIIEGLKRATAQCVTKDQYGKGRHSFKILAKISPDKVKEASPWARRFLDELEKRMRA